VENRINIKNKKAFFNYEIIEKLVAGLELKGTEIKSIRAGKVSLADTYCYYKDHELWVTGMRIAEYDHGGYVNHDPYRDRRLLLNRKELNKWEKQTRERGMTIVALRLFINAGGLAKLEIGLARGKRLYDKRESIKHKDMQRDLDRLQRRH
jgi:SsrA-binding protein